MAEAVGLVASVITIAAVVVEGIKHVKSLCRTREELEVLQVRNCPSFADQKVTVSGASGRLQSLDTSTS